MPPLHYVHEMISRHAAREACLQVASIISNTWESTVHEHMLRTELPSRRV